MPLPVRRRPRARRDLIEIWNYIADRNEAAADRLFDDVERVLLLLADNPQAGRSRAEIARGLRSFPVRQYVIFYRFDFESIVVTRVVSGYQDIERIDLE